MFKLIRKPKKKKKKRWILLKSDYTIIQWPQKKKKKKIIFDILSELNPFDHYYDSYLHKERNPMHGHALKVWDAEHDKCTSHF
jgi:hypothetical protein